MKGLMVLVSFACIGLFASDAEAQIFKRLRAGSTRTVKQSVQCSGGQCTVTQEVEQQTGGRIINRNPIAFAHALKEATLLAQREMVGHPYGVAPGCSKAGTGCSFSANEPNHCFKELPESRIVARAVVRGRSGRYYWSAHYR